MYKIEKQIGKEKLIIETGKYAPRAASSATVRYGDTVVFAVVANSVSSRSADFIQLFVDYRECKYAAGKFPGGFFKREGRPTTKETLTARLIDRSLRPLFPKGFSEEVSVTVMVVSADEKHDPAILALIAASVALSTAKIPVQAVLGAVSVGMTDGDFTLIPTYQEQENSPLDLVVSGSKDSVAMVECGANELPEEEMIKAITFAHTHIREVVGMIEELQEKMNRPLPAWEEIVEDNSLTEELVKGYGEAFKSAMMMAKKTERDEKLGVLKEEILSTYLAKVEDETCKAEREKEVKSAFGKMVKSMTRRMAVEGNRIGGRKGTDIREITCDTELFPRTHGSAMFQRGETQAVVVTTLGTTMDEQKIDGLTDTVFQKFMLHYNFPAYCVGETWPNRGPKRREIGHGALAERALLPLIPDNETFPYTIRIVSEIMGSNGSSSMASVCGGTLSMMDAGVPIKRPVAGIAMGLIKEGDHIEILSDISGEEDHCGDMDFKVAGTQKGITALQMDIKITGVTEEVIQKALTQAKEGRLFILRKMLSSLERPRTGVSTHAPKISIIRINPEKIGAVIGAGGKVIRQLQEQTNTKIEINDDGLVTISGSNAKEVETAKTLVDQMTQTAEVGKIYDGKVTSIKEFGAFVEILPGTEGLLHISEFADHFVRNIRDHVKEGEKMQVKCIGVDDRGKIKLSRRGLAGAEESKKETSEKK